MLNFNNFKTAMYNSAVDSKSIAKNVTVVLVSLNIVLRIGVIQSQLVIYITNNNGVYQSNSPNFVIDCSKKYYFMTHGWKGNASDSNVMASINKINAVPGNLAYYIDWSKITDTDILSYPFIDVPAVAKTLATNTLYPLYDQCKTPFVYMLSLSLGVHMLGLAGRYLQAFGYTVDVIMGLDPSGPLLVVANEGGPIKASDAKQVIVAHTSDLILGTILVNGRTNFYFNGGAVQPKCTVYYCSHIRGLMYFNESLTNPGGFVARPCYTLLGFFVSYTKGPTLNFNAAIPQSASGDYCLNTNAAPPYAQG